MPSLLLGWSSGQVHHGPTASSQPLHLLQFLLPPASHHYPALRVVPLPTRRRVVRPLLVVLRLVQQQAKNGACFPHIA